MNAKVIYIRIGIVSAIALLTGLSIYCSTQISGSVESGQSLAPIDDVPRIIMQRPRRVRPVKPESSWQQTVRLIYADSPNLQRWLDDEPLKVYIYDTLDEQLSIQNISQCIEQRFAVSTIKCGYYPKICNASDSGILGKFHNNYNSDVVTIKRFLEYPHQTKDPQEADLFFVPYPHKSHCLCHQKDFTRTRCKFNIKWIREHVLDRLLYYNSTTKVKHLFVLGSDYEQSNPPFRREIAMDISLGPAGGCRPNRHSKGKHWSEICGSFTMPYVNTMADVQPSAVAALSKGWWVDRPRRYSVAALMGTPGHLAIRVEFIQNQNDLFQQNVGGLPVYLQDLGNSRLSVNPMDIYRNSIFCPILMGDECAQKRFFDVLLAGCIPVVMEYEGDEENSVSWYSNKRCSVRRTYPFARGVYFDDLDAGLDYMSLVVSVNGTCGLPCMKIELEDVMKDKERLKNIRYTMYKYALLFTNSLDPAQNDNHPDAFSAMTVTLRHYLRNLVSPLITSEHNNRL